MKFENVIIIGNGFDLNQHLPTSYSNFINSTEFKQLLSTKNYFAEHLYRKHDLQNWIDVENELTLYSQGQSVQDAVNAFREEFSIVSECLKKYLQTIDYSTLNEEALSYKLIKENIDSEYLILDFNYTETVAKILSTLGESDEQIKNRHIKVHGRLNTDVIFGVEDRARIKNEHVFLRKAYNKNFLAANLNSYLTESSIIHFFGHSLGASDHMYFDDFFSTYSLKPYYKQGKEIHLYFYGEESYNRIFMEMDELTNKQLSKFRQNNSLKFINTM